MKGSLIKVLSIAAAAVLSAGLATLPGCDTDDNAGSIAQPQFSVSPSSREIMVGEIVTVTTRSSNLAGGESQIDWFTTGGNLTTEQNNRVARIQFDRPGNYTVSARLSDADEITYSDSVTINVKPLTSNK